MIKFTRNSKGGDFELLPQGTYEVQILEVKQKTSKNDNPQVELLFEVQDGEHAGKRFRQWYTMTEKAAWRFAALCEAAGVAQQDTGEKDPEGNPIMECDEQELLQRYVRLELAHREFNDKLQLDVKKHHPSALSDAPEAAAAPAAAPAPAAQAAPAPTAGAGTTAAIAGRRPRPAPAAAKG